VESFALKTPAMNPRFCIRKIKPRWGSKLPSWVWPGAFGVGFVLFSLKEGNPRPASITWSWVVDALSTLPPRVPSSADADEDVRFGDFGEIAGFGFPGVGLRPRRQEQVRLNFVPAHGPGKLLQGKKGGYDLQPNRLLGKRGSAQGNQEKDIGAQGEGNRKERRGLHLKSSGNFQDGQLMVS
jgi:hypothetical protein